MERDEKSQELATNFWISTHTLTWSVTGDKLWEFVAGINFNSHAHVERDQTLKAAHALMDNFNSHAHVERDISDTVLQGEDINFNSHAHVERDPQGFKGLRTDFPFQLTRSRGA